MQSYRIQKSTMRGSLELPTSKSHSIRAVFFAALARGESYLKGLLDSPDVEACIAAAKAIGARFEREGNDCWVQGVAGQPRQPAGPIDAGNSGLVLRFFSALGAAVPGVVSLTGDPSIRTQRPVTALLAALSHLGVESESHGGFAPLHVRGTTRGGSTWVDGHDSQPVSSLLMLAPLLQEGLEIRVRNPGEKPWVDLTLSWISRLNIQYERQGHERYWVPGGQEYQAFEYEVPGDFSSAAFPVAAALLTRSQIGVGPLDWEDPQGDKKLFELLEGLGARLLREGNHLTVYPSELKGAEIDVNTFIDAVPVLSVLACFANGPTELRNGAVAREKECDRIAVMAKELRRMGADVTELADGLRIQPCTLKGAEVSSHGDHRVGMALAVAGLGVEGKTLVWDTQCICKTFPRFREKMNGVLKWGIR